MKAQPLALLAVFCALAALAAASPAAAQGGGDLLIRECYTAANDLLKEADRQREKGEFEQAIAKYQEALQEHSQALFPLGTVTLPALPVPPNLNVNRGREAPLATREAVMYVGVADYVEERLGSLPDEAKDLYAARYEKPARALFEQGRDPDRPDSLIRAATLYPVAPSGIAALGLLARRDLQEGRWPEAAARFRAVLARDRFHWERRVPDVLSLALALTREGRSPALAQLAEDTAARLPGDEGRRTAARIAALAVRAKGEPRPPTWLRMFGADGAGLGATDTPVVGAPLSWSANLPLLSVMDSSGEGINSFQNRNQERVGWSVKNLWRPYLPVAAEDRVYVHNGIEVRCLDLLRGGEAIWSRTSPYAKEAREGEPAVGGTAFEPNRVFGATLDGGALYVLREVPAAARDLQGAKFMEFDVIPPIPRRRLLALDALTGRPLWECGAREKPLSFLDKLSFSTEPLALAGRLYLGGAVFEGIPTAYVVCLDARDGRLLWKRRIATGSQELNMFGRPVREYIGSPVSARADALFFCTNLGAVISLRAEDGEWRWAFRYPSTPRSKSINFQTYKTPPSWFPNPVVVTAERAVVAPTDSDYLFGLSVDTGAVAWAIPGKDRWGGGGLLRDHFYLLGAGDGKVFVHGAEVEALALASGKKLWVRGFARDGEHPAGRGALAGGLVFVPTEEALYVFDGKTGDRARRDPWQNGQAEAGSVFLAGGFLLTASGTRLTAYFDQARQLERILAEARQGRPEPRTALRAAWVCLRAGRWEDALSFFRRAREAAGAGSAFEEEIRQGTFRTRSELGAAAWKAGAADQALGHWRDALDSASAPEERIAVNLLLLEAHRLANRPAKTEETLRGMALEFEGRTHPIDGEPLPVAVWARFALARLLAEAGRDSEAVAQYQSLIERSGDVPFRVGARRGPARMLAAAEVASLLARRGRAPYEPFDALARERFEKGKAAGSAEALEEIPRLFPNARTVPEALLEAGRLRLALGETARAEESFRRILREHPDAPGAAQAVAFLVQSMERRKAFSEALPLLARLRDRNASATLDLGGAAKNAGAWARERLASAGYRDLEPGEVRSDARWEGGEALWRCELPKSPEKILPLAGARPPEAPPFVLVRLGTDLQAVAAGAGSVLWGLKDPEYLVQSAGFAGRTLVLADSSRVRGVDPSSGAVRWVRAFPAGWVVRGMAVRGRTASFTTTDAAADRVPSLWLHAVDGDTGADLFPPQTLGDRAYQSVPEMGDAVVVAHNREGEAKVFAFDLGGGRPLFVHSVEGSLQAAPVLFEPQGRVVYATRDTMIGLDLSGRKAWSVTLGTFDRDGVVRAGPVAVCTTTDAHGRGEVAAFDAAGGRPLWRASTDLYPIKSRQAVGRALFVVGKKGLEVRALRFDRDTGALEWDAVLGGRTSTSLTLAFGDTVGVARAGVFRDPRNPDDSGADGSFLFFDLAGGKLLRALPHRGSPPSDTFVVADGVLVYLEKNAVVGWGKKE